MLLSIHADKPKTNVDKFQVTFDDAKKDIEDDSDITIEIEDNSNIQTAPIPLFRRVYTVRVDKQKVIYCTCCAFKIVGLFYVHMVCMCQFIEESYDQTFLGFSY